MEMRANLIAPCGINCRLCMAYQREKKQCLGCNVESTGKPDHCRKCAIVHCEKRGGLPGGFCGECDKPCRRMKYLDASYRQKYHMSPMENLHVIRDEGMDAFLAREETRWRCDGCGGVLCVHREACPTCGRAWAGEKEEAK